MLLERAPFLDQLKRLQREAETAHGRLLLLAGEAGVGKTALARAFLAGTSPHLRLLVGACDPLTTPRPLAPLQDMGMATPSDGNGPGDGAFRAFLEELARPAVVV